MSGGWPFLSPFIHTKPVQWRFPTPLLLQQGPPQRCGTWPGGWHGNSWQLEMKSHRNLGLYPNCLTLHSTMLWSLFFKSHGIVACLPPPTPDQHGPIGSETKLSTSQVQTRKLQKVLQFTVELLLLRAREEGQGTSRCVCPFLLTFQRQSQDHTGMLMLIYCFFKSTRQSKKKEARTSNSQSPRLST